MPINLDARFFVEEPPDIEYRDGLFFVCQTIGDYRFERVMRPGVYMAALKHAADVAGEHFKGGAEVISLAKRLEERAASGH